MKKGIKTLFFDTAPLIYYLEGHPDFFEAVEHIIDNALNNKHKMFTSVITILEFNVKPFRINRPELSEKFNSFLKNANI